MSARRIEIANIANCEVARFQHCTYLSRRFRVWRWWNREEDDDLGKNPKTREDSLRCCAPLRSPLFLPTPPPGAHAHGQKNNARIKKNVRISSSSSAHSLPPATSNWKFLHSPANFFGSRIRFFSGPLQEREFASLIQSRVRSSSLGWRKSSRNLHRR
jgi:hypothetical protein